MKLVPGILLIVILTPWATAAQGARYPEVVVGSVAPPFSLPYATRDSIHFGELSLSDYAGKRNVILAFYPADWSGGCTREVCTFRDNFEDLASLDAEILGISGDYPYSHHEWARQHDLPFKLLSDHRHSVAADYNSYNASTGYNRRTVYLIDREGRVAYRDLEYSTKDMASFEKLLAALKQLKRTD